MFISHHYSFFQQQITEKNGVESFESLKHSVVGDEDGEALVLSQRLRLWGQDQPAGSKKLPPLWTPVPLSLLSSSLTPTSQPHLGD